MMIIARRDSTVHSNLHGSVRFHYLPEVGVFSQLGLEWGLKGAFRTEGVTEWDLGIPMLVDCNIIRNSYILTKLQ